MSCDEWSAPRGSGPTPLELAAASGAMALTGRPDGPPLSVPPGILTAAAADCAAIATLTRGRVALDGPRLLSERAACQGLGRRGPWSVGGACRALPTADGWLAVSLARPSDLDAVPAVVERDDPGPPWSALAAWARHATTDIAVARLRLLDLPAARVPLVPGASPPEPGVGSTRLPSAAPRPRALGGPPVVVDLSSLWAGPMCAHVLGLAGHRVVKVESLDRPDGARRGSPRSFDLLHGGHESVALDFADPTGRDSLRRLLASADVVIEASRPRALHALGLDPRELLRDDAVWVGVTAHGRDGDAGGFVGFGDDVAAAGGAWVLDPATGEPLPALDAVADPLTGLAAARAVLEARERGGRWFLDAAMRRVVAAAVGPSPTPRADPARFETGRWCAHAPGGARFEVRDPVARVAAHAAPAMGADTSRVLDELAAVSEL